MASPDICRILIGNKKDMAVDRGVEESRARKVKDTALLPKERKRGSLVISS